MVMLFIKVEKIGGGAGMEGDLARWGRGGHLFDKEIHMRYNESKWHHMVMSGRNSSHTPAFFPI